MARKKKTTETTAAAATQEVPAATTTSTKVESIPATTTMDANLKPTTTTTNGTSATNGTSMVVHDSSSDDETATTPHDGSSKYDVPDGLSKSQKKNLKKKLREKEKKAEEAAGIRRGVAQMPEDPLQSERLKVAQSVTKALSKLSSLAEMKSVDVLEKFREQQDALQDLLTTIVDGQENLCTKIKKPDNRRLQSTQLLERIRELSTLQERDEVAVDYLEDQLVLTVSWENARKFQNQLMELRQKIEDRQRSNQKCYDGARAWEKKVKLVDRIKVLKQLSPDGVVDVDSITATKISSVEIEVTSDAQIVLLPPSNIYRRMEKVFSVAVDRSSDKMRQRTFLISGLEKDVDEAVEFLQQADFSGGCKVAVDAKLLPQLIGKGGSGIRQLEETFKCFFQTRENNDVVVYGARAKSPKAVEHIAGMKLDRSGGSDQAVAVVPIDHSAIARSLTSIYSKAIREIEAKHTVTTRVASGPPPNAVNVPEAAFGADVSSEAPAQRKQPSQSRGPQQSVLGGPTITIRGNNKAGVDSARAAITKLVSTLRALELASTNDSMKRLFNRVSFNGEVDLSRGTRSPTGGRGGANQQPSVGDRFCDLVGLNSDIAFMRHGDALAIVGTPEAIAKVHEEAKQLVETAGFTPTRVSVLGQQLPIFSSARLAEIAEATGAKLSVRRLRTGDAVNIEILGNEAQKAQAVEMVNNVVKNEAVIETFQINDRETLNQLLRQSAAQIRSLEEQHGTRISVDRSQMTCTVVGSPNGIAATRAALKKMDVKNAELESRSIAIPSIDMIRRLIGTKGATISQIRATSKVDAIDVNDKDLIAIVRGTPEACDEAEKQITELFNTPARPSRNTAAPSQATNTPASRSKAQTVVAASPAFGLGWGESVVPEGDHTSVGATPSSPQSSPSRGVGTKGWASGGGVRSNAANTESEAFPTLGEVVTIGKATKRQHRKKQQPQQASSGDAVNTVNNDDVEIETEDDTGTQSPVDETNEDEEHEVNNNVASYNDNDDGPVIQSVEQSEDEDDQ